MNLLKESPCLANKSALQCIILSTASVRFKLISTATLGEDPSPFVQEQDGGRRTSIESLLAYQHQPTHPAHNRPSPAVKPLRK